VDWFALFTKCGLFFIYHVFFGAIGSLGVFGTIAIFCIRDSVFVQRVAGAKDYRELLEDCSADGCRSIKRGLGCVLFLYDTIMPAWILR
jgi:hypothetical protein